ncbi:hypothetical protein FNF27_01941 [Cafeteria roenbergensis]|uniref:phosphoribosylformylglycinamidine synthase n=2 Tax=Cafeteria roenbergensis TaxID=33653 RepID=A0A5A8CY09_CAFRO|nr:hypothetical protein FNF29_00432 [Cafeteria roenbergensis]KAA0176660.1 hypothetical protein FNF27_01941 [Cafeteria roenbergensis]|eukprot:KAA0157080.1 hypothetical protein FNF29_00432 [Cafeteria roenbergensis]
MADAIAFAATVGAGAGLAVARATGKDGAAAASAASKREAEVAATTAATAAPGAGGAAAVAEPDLIRIFRKPLLDAAQAERLRARINAALAPASDAPTADGAAPADRIAAVDTEVCFYVDMAPGSTWAGLPAETKERLMWVLRETYEPENVSLGESFLAEPVDETAAIIEVGPRLTFTSAFSTNAVGICESCGVPVRRLERYRRFRISAAPGAAPLSADETAAAAALVHDKMTEWRVAAPLRTFASAFSPEPTRTVPVLAEGAAAIERESSEQGLSFDAADVAYLLDLFVNRVKRDPTTVELFDFSQSNSEHSRHWFFKGLMVIDGEEMPHNLMEVVAEPQKRQAHNSVIAFFDNSSVIEGFRSKVLLPEQPGAPSRLVPTPRTRHLLLTAETHNFPSGVAPFPGAETGTGGRLRDTHATGRGSLCAAGIAGYCVGALNIPGYHLPWEHAPSAEWPYPPNLASPLQIEVEASNGASDYGNKFGEPVVQGFTRSFGLRLPVVDGAAATTTGAAAGAAGAAAAARGQRREWIKPIMFSAGIGQLDAEHAVKGRPEAGMLITKVGGPAYRIGMGGSAASSMVQGENAAALDLDAVQRGDAEMENKLNRVVRACVELGSDNPIVSIHDQGAGGNCNVLKEICEPLGGTIELTKVPLGDPSLSQKEIWGAEYQENDALLVRPGADAEAFGRLCERERVPFAFVGEVTDDTRIVVTDARDGSTPFDLRVDDVLGEVPRKTFHLARSPRPSTPLEVDWPSLTAEAALGRVLRLLSVGSKRFLTVKVDRSVSGLIAQQQCVGPLHTPLADVAVVASSHFETHGVATAVGEQPIKGLLDPAAMARLSVGEAVTNMMMAPISGLRDVKCSANWMWAAKMAEGGEGAALWDAAVAMRDAMIALELSVDGGKDSLSMAARCPDGETVKAPGELTITLYGPCTDITGVVTPDLKRPGASVVVYADLSGRKGASGLAAAPRLGGTSLAHVFGQLGDVPPDMDDPAVLQAAFGAVQTMMSSGWVLAGHDVSDGGLITALLEMAFAGNCGIDASIRAEEAEHSGAAPAEGVRGAGILLPVDAEDDAEDVADAAADGASAASGAPAGDEPAPAAVSALPAAAHTLAALFSEELGVLLEVAVDRAEDVVTTLRTAGVPAGVLAKTVAAEGAAPARITVRDGETAVLSSDVATLRDVWEATSFQLDKLQANPDCVEQERAGMAARRDPFMELSFRPEPTPAAVLTRPPTRKHAVCVLREEGSNGDREMAAAFLSAGFDVWDVCMGDLAAGRVTLDRFRGIAFVGGFSYADVLDSAKGWAASIRLNPAVRAQFEAFRTRSNTFSLGVCNGCQLLALLGWVPFPSEEGSAAAAADKAGAFEGGAALADPRQPRFVHNASGRYESRFVSVRIAPGSPAVMLRGMEGSSLGVWVAHGEGRALFPDSRVMEAALERGLAPLRYVDEAGEPTEVYPFNPNGSPQGIAGMCSRDGRHLALMPHPERCFQTWQWPWMPAAWRKAGDEPLAASPWMRLFQNARVWCEATAHPDSVC